MTDTDLSADAPDWANLFEVESVEKTSATQDSDGIPWHRYVLTDGTTKITGQRRGTLREVSAHADDCVKKLNLRRLGKATLASSAPGRRSNAAAKSR